MTSLHVICTSAGNDGFPSVLAALRVDPGIRVTAVDSDSAAAGLMLAGHGKIVPHRTHATALLSVVHDLQEPGVRNVLLPLSTEDQDFFAFHRSKIERNGIDVIVASTDALLVANDKHELYKHCTKIGTRVPKYVIVHSIEELEKIFLEYVENGSRCVIKLARGTGAQGVKIIAPDLDRSGSFWSRTKLVVHPADALDWFREYGLAEAVLVSDYLPGEHVSVDAIRLPNGAFRAAARTETRQLYGLALAGAIVEAPDVIAASQRLAETIGLIGALNFEYRRDNNGVAHLLEINPRFAGSIGHTVAAGLNLPLMLLERLPIDHGHAAIGTSFSRHWSIVTRIEDDAARRIREK